MSERDKLYMLAIGWVNLESIISVIEDTKMYIMYDYICKKL
jgi:hypothetical protein